MNSYQKRYFQIFVLLGFLFLWISMAPTLEIPPPSPTRVTDYANLLSIDFRNQLEKKLSDFEKKTTHQVIVVVFPSLEGEKMEAFTLRLMNQWGIGQKGKNNGVGLLIFYKDRRLRLEVGKGLTTVLTDAKAQSILDRNVVPQFKKGNFEGGISSGVQGIFEVLK